MKILSAQPHFQKGPLKLKKRSSERKAMGLLQLEKGPLQLDPEHSREAIGPLKEKGLLQMKKLAGPPEGQGPSLRAP